MRINRPLDLFLGRLYRLAHPRPISDYMAPIIDRLVIGAYVVLALGIVGCLVGIHLGGR